MKDVQVDLLRDDKTELWILETATLSRKRTLPTGNEIGRAHV